MLLLSEVVGNSVQHSGRPSDEEVDVLIEPTAQGVHVEVRDPGPGETIAPTGDAHHAGLQVVEALAERWGVSHDPTTVWFDVV
jgi:anti-sigma regulatory factor (Ser/Thr protein kinase)